MAVGNENELNDEELVDETLEDTDPDDDDKDDEGGDEEGEDDDDEDEPDTEDPMDNVREACEAKSECIKLKEEFEVCNERVNGKSKTTETCAQELLDFIHCRDHCVSKSIFSKIK